MDEIIKVGDVVKLISSFDGLGPDNSGVFGIVVKVNGKEIGALFPFRTDGRGHSSGATFNNRYGWNLYKRNITKASPDEKAAFAARMLSKATTRDLMNKLEKSMNININKNLQLCLFEDMEI